jgi:hypothetical protein
MANRTGQIEDLVGRFLDFRHGFRLVATMADFYSLLLPQQLHACKTLSGLS